MAEFDLTATSSNLARSTEKTVFIDVGAKKVDAKVTRDGVPIGVFRIDTAVLDPIIVTRPTQKQRVVSQSVPAGTPVPLGTAVDLVLAEPGKLPIGIVSGTHQVLKGLEVDAGHKQFVAGNPQVKRLIGLAAAGPLAPEDRQVVVDLFAAQGIELHDRPGHDVTAAVETLRVLTAFGEG